jgi:signal peptidase II
MKLLMFGLPILFLDSISKALTHSFVLPTEWGPSFYPYGGIPVFQNWKGVDFCINHVTNRGAAWGAFASWQTALLLLRVGVIGIVTLSYLFSKKAKQHQYPLILIIVGGIGNVIDYFVYGHVVDMFHFVFWGYSYPVFNIADAAITCGVIWIALQTVLTKKRSSHAATKA